MKLKEYLLEDSPLLNSTPEMINQTQLILKEKEQLKEFLSGLRKKLLTLGLKEDLLLLKNNIKMIFE